VVTSLKPSRDSKALIVRLFNVSDGPGEAELLWAKKPKSTWRSNPGEDKVSKLKGAITLAKHEILTLRAVF